MTKLRARLDRSDDQGVAMLSVVMLLMIVTVFSLIVLGLVLSQVSPTLFSSKNSRTIVAAQAGMDATLAQLRNATSSDATGLVLGDIHKLPCVVTGTVDGTGGEAHYTASVQYFDQDPDGQTAQWREDNAFTCYLGTGLNGGVRAVPLWAMVTSEGFDDTATVMVDRGDRIIEAKYTFQLTTRKVSGGMILDKDGNYCLVAARAEAGANIYYRPSGSAYCAEQTVLNAWSWREDYMIHLTATDSGGNTPLCLSGRNTGSATPTPMTLQNCGTATTDTAGQRYSWTGDYTWRGQNSTNTAYANSYIVNEDATVGDGDRLSVANTPTYRSLTPLAAVGKGNASKATDQVVNQNQFGRCLDVTNTRIWYSYMIAYPCKQDPTGGGAFDWNHKWYYTEPGDGVESVSTKVRVNTGSTWYCMIAPTTTTSGLQGQPVYTGYGSYYFPRFVTGNEASYAGNCTTANSDWVRYGYSPDARKAYTIQDRYGRCLSAGGPKITQDGGAGTWTSIVVVTCDASDDQKWNVPDVPVGATIGDYSEVTGRTG